MPGTVLGTPQYAAPEQLRGEAIDPRADLFAAGAVMFEMLAGKPPFAGKSAVEIFHAIMYEQPPVLTGGPAVVALDRVVSRALAKQPADRYQTADAMAQDLRSALRSATPAPSRPAHVVTRLIVLPFRVLRSGSGNRFPGFQPGRCRDERPVGPAVAGRPFEPGRVAVCVGFAGPEGDRARRRKSMRCSSARCCAPAIRFACRRSSSRPPAATVLWSHTAQVPVGDLFRLQDELTSKIVESLVGAAHDARTPHAEAGRAIVAAGVRAVSCARTR